MKTEKKKITGTIAFRFRQVLLYYESDNVRRRRHCNGDSRCLRSDSLPLALHFLLLPSRLVFPCWEGSSRGGLAERKWLPVPNGRQRRHYEAIITDSQHALWQAALIRCPVANVHDRSLHLGQSKGCKYVDTKTYTDSEQTSWLHRASNNVETFLLPTDAHNVKKHRVIKTF